MTRLVLAALTLTIMEIVARAATYNVTTTADSGAGSLRQAILTANTNGGPDIIQFSIPGTNSVFTIAPLTPLPAITDAVTIDGYTQIGASPSTSSSGINATLKIEISGNNLSAGQAGLTISAADCVVKGLIVNRSPGSGIALFGANAVIQGNFIGTDSSGSIARANGDGIVISAGSTCNQIGGVSPAERNLISGNQSDGIRVHDSTNLVSGNLIGPNANGTTIIGQNNQGVLIAAGSGNVIGGTALGAGNVVSGNRNGIWLNAGSSNTLVQGNIVGLDIMGTAALPNREAGVFVINSIDNLIGGSEGGARNILSANNFEGIKIEGASSQRNRVEGNFIGTDITGTLRRGNTNAGVLVWKNASGNLLGGSASGAGNLISGNRLDGIRLEMTAEANRISGNLIGIDASGLLALGNGETGILITSGSHDNIVGGATAASRNIISGNTNDGVSVRGAGTTNNLVEGNWIGLNAAGTAAIGNGVAGGTESLGLRIGFFNASHNVARSNVICGNLEGGVSLDNGGFSNTLEGNLIGTDPTGTLAIPNGGKGVVIQSSAHNNLLAGNLISGNNGVGVYIYSAAYSNRLSGNLIGTDITGTRALGNTSLGIYAISVSWNRIGGATPVARNVISGNGSEGIAISSDGTSSNNWVQGNFIGTDIYGTNRIENFYNGVNVHSAYNFIGGTNAGEGNLISGNRTSGVHVWTDVGLSNVIVGNWIGVDITGRKSLFNGNYGVWLDGGSNNIVGGVTEQSRNVIAGNNNSGIRIEGAGGNQILGNLIGIDATGTNAMGNGPASSGVSIEQAANTIVGLPGAGNVIGGNSNAVHIYAATTNILLQGNFIGISSDGRTPLPQRNHGIWIVGGLSNRVGGTLGGEANLIAFNGGDGVYVQGGTRHTISGNSIFANGGLGIDLGANGPTPNDVNDADAGANNLLNFPVPVSAATEIQTLVSCLLQGPPLTPLTVELFVSDSPDSTGYGEGQTFLWATNVSSGTNAGFTCVLPVPIPPGRWISATATDPQGNTSEFSPAIRVTSLTLPDIAVPPTNRTVRAGTNVNFSVQATGFAPLSYQWLFNGVPLPMATSATLSLPSVQPSVAGNFSVVVQNAFGVVTSQVAALSVTIPPTVVTHPQSQTVLAGANVTFTASASGTFPLTFRWLKNSGIRFAETVSSPDSAFTLTNVQPADSGNYRVAITNAASANQNTFSSFATLTVLSPLAANAQPTGTNVALGSTATFCVSLSTGEPALYQWRHNGAHISEATNACLTITNVQLADGGTYDVVIENPSGTLTSSNALLTIDVPSVPPGDNFTNRVSLGAAFTNSVSGTNFLATKEIGETNHAGKPGGKSVWYTWTAPTNGIATFRTVGSAFDTLLAIYTGSSVTILMNVADDDDSGGFFTSQLQFNARAGTSYAIAIDGFAGAEGAFVLSWELEPTTDVLPQITAQPVSRTVLENANATFTVTASGNGLAYQWSFNGAPLAGATSATLLVANVQPENVGFYSVRVSNSSGRVAQSDEAILEIGPEPDVQSQDKFADLFLAADGGAVAPLRLSTPKGAASPGFLSLAAGVPLSLVVNNTNSSTERFEPTDCRITGASRWMTMRAVENGFCIVSTPGSSNTTVSVYTGSNYLTLRLVICDGAPDGMGSQVKFAATAGVDYRVRVDGVQARQGIIRVNAQLGHAPVLSATMPTNPPAEFGQPLVLPAPMLETNSGASLFYQWQLDERDIPGATSDVYAVAALQASDAGQYSVRLRNEFDQVVHTFPPITLHITYLNPAPQMIDGTLRLTVQRSLDQNLILEGSDDMQAWTPIHTVPITIAGPAIDVPLTNLHRFFRARPWP